MEPASQSLASEQNGHIHDVAQLPRQSGWHDLLTGARGLFLLAILILIPAGLRNIGLVTGLYLAAWTTDIFDGRIARKKQVIGYLAPFDFPFDMLLIWSGTAYLAWFGLFTAPLFWIWTGVWSLAASAIRNRALTMLIAFSGIVACTCRLYSASIFWFWIAMAWIFWMLYYEYRRFAEVIKEFIDSAKEIMKRRTRA